MAIVIAIACGVVAGFLPLDEYDYANTIGADAGFRIWHLENELLRAEEEWKPLVDSDLYNKRVAEVKKAVENERKKNEFFESERKKSFCYNLSRAELIGMVVLYGLGGVVAGYVGAWAILWYGGLAIFVFIHWLALGFREDKPENEQKQ